MAEKDKTEKLGPNVTYLGNNDEDKQSVTMGGVQFKPGESVNLEQRLGKQRATPILQKLAGNTFFKVDGGPDHRKQQEEKAKAEQEESAAAQKEAEQKMGEQYKAPDEMSLESREGTSTESVGGRRRASQSPE